MRLVSLCGAITVYAAMSSVFIGNPALAQEANAQAVAPAQNGVMLWREFQVGMSPEQVAEVAKRIEGIREVKLKYDKSKNPEIRLKYINSGISIFKINFGISFGFKDRKLWVVQLTSSSYCASYAYDVHNLIFNALSEKYPRLVNQSSSSDKQSEGMIGSFHVYRDRSSDYKIITDEKTRVQHAIKVVGLAKLPDYPSKDPNNSFDMTYIVKQYAWNDQNDRDLRNLNNCASRDLGKTAIIELMYMDEVEQSAAAAERARLKQENEMRQRQRNEDFYQNEADKL